MTWLLIFALFGNGNYNPALTSAQFQSKELCEAAGKEAVDAMPFKDKARFVCVRTYR